jgi:hypothetical protein
LYFSPDIVCVIRSKKKKWAGHVAWTCEKRNAHRVSVRKPDRKRPLERLRHRWKDNIKMDIKEIECEGMELIHLP